MQHVLYCQHSRHLMLLMQNCTASFDRVASSSIYLPCSLASVSAERLHGSPKCHGARSTARWHFGKLVSISLMVLIGVPILIQLGTLKNIPDDSAIGSAPAASSKSLPCSPTVRLLQTQPFRLRNTEGKQRSHLGQRRLCSGKCSKLSRWSCDARGSRSQSERTCVRRLEFGN